MRDRVVLALFACVVQAALAAGDFQKPYSPPCVERENVFAFAEKPAVRLVGPDRYEITFAVKGNCDVAVAVVDAQGRVVRHVGAGVLGANAPAPFRKNSLSQSLVWDGKDDLKEYPPDAAALRVRVMLGLKPEFDKRLGGTSPHNIPARIIGLAASPEGVFVLSLGGRSKFFIRRFDLDGDYVQSLVPPAANLPEEKLRGMGFVEFEPGRKALHGVDVHQTVSDHMRYPVAIVGKRMGETQPAIVGNRLYFANTGEYGVPSAFYYMYTDGSTDAAGISGRPLLQAGRGGLEHWMPRFCAPPDGKCLYFAGATAQGGPAPCVFKLDPNGQGPAVPWVGNPGEPGSAADRFNRPLGIACDSAGRVYVADSFNGRVQVFAPDARLVKSIPIDKPMYLCVHPKTGAIYVQHDTRVEGKTVRRVSKLASAENPSVVAFVDGPYGTMALDSWSAKPRLWFSNTAPGDLGLLGDSLEIGNNVTAWEDAGTSFRKVIDFDEIARREDGEFYAGRWSGHALGHKVACDPTRETVMVGNRRLYDLKTGRFVTDVKIPAYSYDDVAFDKRGYMHAHLNPGFDGNPGVLRVDPGKARPTEKGMQYWPETPYDYGIELPGAYSEPRKGVLPARDQPGAKFFQDGIGVTMRGDVAIDSNIYYVPKFDDMARDFIAELRGALPPGAGGRFPSYEAYSRQMQDKLKRGEEVYSIRREPGIQLAGATVWTFNQDGEIMEACAVTAGGLINGTMTDEDGGLYFVLGLNGRTRMAGGRPFLTGAAGHFGAAARLDPFTGTLVKSRGSGVKVLWNDSPIRLEPAPSRPPDVAGFGSTDTQGQRGWVEGAEWLYAGASPIVAGGCSCPTQRLHVDWFKRVYVPEQYRHSIGVLDTAGNLILHVGQYGNFDSGDGAKSRVPVGGDGIAMSAVRFVSSTDNFMVFDDGGERLTVLKLGYHAEESAPVK